MARVVEEPLARGASTQELDPLVDDAARDVHARVTIIALDGRVLGDSALSGAELLHVENHGTRPEVREALRRGAGSSVRHSATVEQDLLYAAVPVRHQERLVGVSRVALPLQGVEEQVAGAPAERRGSPCRSPSASRPCSRRRCPLPWPAPCGEIMGAARQFAVGQPRRRASAWPAETSSGELARILNHSADQLQRR